MARGIELQGSAGIDCDSGVATDLKEAARFSTPKSPASDLARNVPEILERTLVALAAPGDVFKSNLAASFKGSSICHRVGTFGLAPVQPLHQGFQRQMLDLPADGEGLAWIDAQGPDLLFLRPGLQKASITASITAAAHGDRQALAELVAAVQQPKLALTSPAPRAELVPADHMHGVQQPACLYFDCSQTAAPHEQQALADYTHEAQQLGLQSEIFMHAHQPCLCPARLVQESLQPRLGLRPAADSSTAAAKHDQQAMTVATHAMQQPVRSTHKYVEPLLVQPSPLCASPLSDAGSGTKCQQLDSDESTWHVLDGRDPCMQSTVQLLHLAATGGHLASLKWLHALCDSMGEAEMGLIGSAAVTGQLHVMQYLMAKPDPVPVCNADIFDAMHHPACLLWLLQQDPLLPREQVPIERFFTSNNGTSVERSIQFNNWSSLQLLCARGKITMQWWCDEDSDFTAAAASADNAGRPFRAAMGPCPAAASSLGSVLL
ncbi:hypothetical protein WJX74_003605 [Apatococcus lobatus]|uniref:Uncharacterized protein n=1 Tax=Apatococcus lobatus TaxID=904363 RepID=A0AAW1QWZ1_9CHLO